MSSKFVLPSIFASADKYFLSSFFIFMEVKDNFYDEKFNILELLLSIIKIFLKNVMCAQYFYYIYIYKYKYMCVFMYIITLLYLYLKYINQQSSSIVTVTNLLIIKRSNVTICLINKSIQKQNRAVNSKLYS